MTAKEKLLLAGLGLFSLLPAILFTVSVGLSGMPALNAGARLTAFTAMALLFLQPVLSSRFRWLDSRFGLDRLLVFHRLAGIGAFTFAVLHPLFLILDRGITTPLFSPVFSWGITAGRAVLAVMVIFCLAALFRASFRIPYQKWLLLHGLTTPFILVFGFMHGWRVLIRFLPEPVQAVLLAYLIIGTWSWIHLWFIRARARLRPWKVESVMDEGGGVTRLVLSPPEGIQVPDYLPGQFMFLTLLRGRGLPAEEHPFTIVSAPGSSTVSVGIKDLGDFTSTVRRTRPGDRAVVCMPFGRFSFLRLPERTRLVFIAGGIGITPFMSMIEYLSKKDTEREVLLVYGNRSSSGIAFCTELSALEEIMNLSVIHVLSRPEETWEGRKGRITGAMLKELIGDVNGTQFMICGPPAMMDSAAASLLLMGVKPEAVHMERFSL